jgi:putative transcriptional regulator
VGVSAVLDLRAGGVSRGVAEVPVVKNRLKVLRAERDWSQGDLARRLEVSRQSVNAIETGKYDPSLPLAFRLARVFGLRIEEIFEEETEGS